MSLPDNTQHSQETDIHAPVGFEPTIPASERPQTHALDRAATGTGIHIICCFNTLSEDVYFFTTLSESRTVHLQRRTVGETCLNFQKI